MYRKYLKRWLDFVIVLCAGCHLFDIGFSHLVWYKINNILKNENSNSFWSDW